MYRKSPFSAGFSSIEPMISIGVPYRIFVFSIATCHSPAALIGLFRMLFRKG